jgi:hypothetical protein
MDDVTITCEDGTTITMWKRQAAAADAAGPEQSAA